MRSIYKFIVSKLSSNNENQVKQLTINWFGGEPTLSAKLIVPFMKSIGDYCNSNDISLYSTMTANGYLLDNELFTKFYEVSITDFQVTIDGNANTHDLYRSLRNGDPTFSTIYSNLINIQNKNNDKEYRLRVRCNFLKSNIESLHQFLQRFVKDFSSSKQFEIYFRPVYEYDTRNNDIQCLSKDIFTIDEGIKIQNEFAMEVKKLTNKPIERRIFDPLPSPTKCWCNADRLSHFIFGPKGEIFMCDTLTASENVLGQLNPDGSVTMNEQYSKWKYDIFNDYRTQKCISDCKILPICYGGCRRERIESEVKCYWTESAIYRAMDTVYSASKN